MTGSSNPRSRPRTAWRRFLNLLRLIEDSIDYGPDGRQRGRHPF